MGTRGTGTAAAAALARLLRAKVSDDAALFRRIPRRLTRDLLAISARRRDVRQSTYASSRPFSSSAVRRHPDAKSAAGRLSAGQASDFAAVTSLYLSHRFDLLGSGWVRVEHGMRCRGLEAHRYPTTIDIDGVSGGDHHGVRVNAANQDESRRIWGLVDQDYTPIDWQIDFKSGYRWREETWYRDIAFGSQPGADVKVPWELARMQHLPQLSIAHRLACEGLGGLSAPSIYANEVRNQILDFIASNPPRFGVNWTTAMEVSIRAVNWLVAVDLLRAAGADLDHAFADVFSRSLYEHGQHIVGNLEWGSIVRGNHYLADVVGLLFIAAFLPGSRQTDAWLAFAVQELVNEVGYQFTDDGANFEASTSYHGLAAELVVYATALVLGLPPDKVEALASFDPSQLNTTPPLGRAPLAEHPVPGTGRSSPFPGWYLTRLEKMAEFVQHITKPTGNIPQIGDCDSGRLLKLWPDCRRLTVAEAKARYVNLEGYNELPDDAPYWDEDHLDQSHLVAAINGLFTRDDFDRLVGQDRPETSLVRILARGTTIKSYRLGGRPAAAAQVRIRSAVRGQEPTTRIEDWNEGPGVVLDIPIPGSNLLRDLELYAYPDFGLFLFRSLRLYLAVRCGPVGQAGAGGHAHNDQLSIELNVDGEDWLVDPGTYLYTPLPARRNEYRSVRAHFVPQPGGAREPGRLDIGLFRLGDDARAECLYFGSDQFIGRHHAFGRPWYRRVRLEEHGVQVTDYPGGEGGVVPIEPGALRPWGGQRRSLLPESPGYGIRIR